MQTADVTSQPLQVQFTLYPAVTNEAFTSNSQYQVDTYPLAQVESLVPAVKTALADLDPLLQSTLGDVFNQFWLASRATQVQAAITSITQQAAAAGHSISNVQLFAPLFGTVTATVDTAADTGGDPMLGLSYQLPGFVLTFDYLPLASWKDTFDMTFSISTPVPVLPFGFAPTASAQGSNANFGPNNWEASLDAALDDFFTAIANFFSSSPPSVSDYQWTQSQIEGETDSAESVAAVGQLVSALTDLDQSGPQVTKYGFTEFAFSIENGDTLTATLTHPRDPGPVVQDATDPTTGGGIGDLLPAVLSADDSVVAPGTTLGVDGQDFPAATATQLYLQWPNTATGTVDRSSELLIVDGSSSTKVSVQPATGPTPPGIAYVHNATGLTPSAEYRFTARCRDTVAWSDWSDQPLTLVTRGSDEVFLQLYPAGSPSKAVQVGTAMLSSTSGGWTSSVVIPGTTTPGVYTLAAVVDGEGLASLSLNIGAPVTHLDIIDPSTQKVIQSPVVSYEQSFTVRGQDFPNGAVALTIDGQSVGSVTAVNGSFVTALTTPAALTGHQLSTVTATGGGKTASVTYEQVGQLI